MFTVTLVNSPDAWAKLNKGPQGNLSIEHESLMSPSPYNSYSRDRLAGADLVSFPSEAGEPGQINDHPYSSRFPHNRRGANGMISKVPSPLTFRLHHPPPITLLLLESDTG